MSTVTLHDAITRLPEIISGLSPGEQLVIVEGNQPIATLTRTPGKQWPSKAGSAKNTAHWMASDFDAPLAEFREYMQ